MSKRKEKKQEFPVEFNDTIDALIDKLKNPPDNLPEGFVIEYEINNLEALAQVLKQKLHYRMPKGKKVVLWHGTSLSRANSILKSGFKSKRQKSLVFFSSNIMVSLDFGEERASAHSEPAIFAAICDSSKLTHSIAFGYEYYCRADVANQIVKYLLTCRGLYAIDTKRFIPQLTQSTDKLKSARKWTPPEIPRELRQIVDANRYAKMLRDGQELLAERAMVSILGFDTLRTQPALLNPSNCTTTNEYYSRSDIQEIFYRYASGRRFRVGTQETHFRLQQPSDVLLLQAHFESSEKNLPSSEAKGWHGFECTRAKYNFIDNTITACDIGIEIDFAESDYTSAVKLAQKLMAVLSEHEIFCFLKCDGDKMLELIIPAEALPMEIDGQKTALKIHQITSGLNSGFRKIKEVRENACRLIIPPYGYTKPAYSLNPETGLASIILMPEDLQDFSSGRAKSNGRFRLTANPASVSINKSWFEIPAKAPLQAQRFLKYALSPNWQPIDNLA